MVQGGTTPSYQFPRTSSNKTSFVDIHQVRISQINLLPNRQQNSNFLSIENGRRVHSKPDNDSFIKRDLESFVEKEHNYFSQIPSQCSKKRRQIGRQETAGTPRIGNCILRFGHPHIDLFASRLSHQLENYLSWIRDPHREGVDAMQQN